MTRHRIAQIGENRNPKSPENRPQTRRFLQIRLLQLRRSATPFNGLAVLHGRLNARARAASQRARRLTRRLNAVSEAAVIRPAPAAMAPALQPARLRSRRSGCGIT